MHAKCEARRGGSGWGHVGRGACQASASRACCQLWGSQFVETVGAVAVDAAQDKGDLKPAKKLAKVRSVKELDLEKGFGAQQDDSPVDVPEDQIKKIKGSAKP